MKKLLIVVALMVSIGLAGGLMAQPASAFFFGGGCGNGVGFFGPANCGPAYCAPVYCGPVYCAPYVCAPYCYPPCMKVKKAKKAKKAMKPKKMEKK